jgi:hypothetical protein
MQTKLTPEMFGEVVSLRTEPRLAPRSRWIRRPDGQIYPYVALASLCTRLRKLEVQIEHDPVHSDRSLFPRNAPGVQFFYTGKNCRGRVFLAAQDATSRLLADERASRAVPKRARVKRVPAPGYTVETDEAP